MSFQNRLFFTFFILIIILVIVIGFGFYNYTTNKFEENSNANLQVVSDKMSRQLDNLIKTMDFITTYLLTTDEFMTSMTSLATLNREDPQNYSYINDAKIVIRSNVTTYTIDKNFYRVSMFNRYGDFITSNFRTPDVNSDVVEKINNLRWLDQVDKGSGKAIIIAPYMDPWSISNNQKVFSVMRSIQGPKGGMGYIEVQNKYEELQRIFTVSDDENLKVLAVTANGQILFNSLDKDYKILLNNYSNISDSSIPKISTTKNTITSRDEIVVGVKSEYTGIKIFLVQDRGVLLKPIVYSGYMTIGICLLIIIISLGYIYIFSRQLSKPIRELKENIEKTELDNLPEKITYENTNNEFKALNRSFDHLRGRLNDSVSREIKSRTLQIQASLDSLQAQVNPHFIFNILNVLANKGFENDDEEITEICDSIAAMLRYSTSTINRIASIKEELEHVTNYLLLMKKRYEYKLEFNIDVTHEIYKQDIPKIVLQQIVENSINHGYHQSSGIMKIAITGFVTDSNWYIQIRDNGDGFTENVINELNQKMAEIKTIIKNSESLPEFSIGGMGLVNTFARLYMFYNGNEIFNIRNLEEGGACVTIGAQMKTGEDRND